METYEKTGYKTFIQHCLDNDDLDAVCNLKDYNKMTEQLKNDGFLGAAE